MTGLSRFLVKDARGLRRAFQEERLGEVDLVLTSPPYFDVKDYGNAQGQIGRGQTYSEYIDDVADVLGQCYEVSTSNAALWLVVDTIRRDGTTYPIPFDINRKLSDLLGQSAPNRHTWILRDVIIWNRSKNIPWHGKGRLKNEFEYILFLTKGNEYKYHVDSIRDIADYKKWWLSYPERYNSGGRPPSNVWEFTTPIRGWGNGYQQHLCPFPFPLVERILSLSSDECDVVLDPFAGSGAVLAMAEQMGRSAIGFDINAAYKQQFEREVLVGARKYWEKRAMELKSVQERTDLFRDTNLALRKIKAGTQLAKAVRAAGAQALVIVADDSTQAPGIKVTVVLEAGDRVDTSALEVCMRELRSVYKLSVSMQFLDRTCLDRTGLAGQQLYAYADDRIFSYSHTSSIGEIVETGTAQPYVFSDIPVSIDNPDRYFR